MKLPSLSVLTDNDKLNVGIKERKIAGEVKLIDLYVTSNEEYVGAIRMRISDGKWKINKRIQKDVDDNNEAVKLSRDLSKSLEFADFLKVMYDYGFEEEIGEYSFIKKHLGNQE